MGGDVETVKERLDIAEVIGGYVKLDKAGASFKGRCPFHNEKSPSFFVSPARQSYYCFGCGAKGDIFSFFQEVEGLSFREALKSLAERAGVEITNKKVDQKEKGEKERIRASLERGTVFFESTLLAHPEAREYLKSRGISDSSVKNWRLGYAPAEWRALYGNLLQAGFNKDILIKAGLVKPVQDGGGKEPYDVFRDRLIFPLFDSNGDVIAFSGRALAKETEPKYLNSPDTVLFTKSEVLYGLDKAKEKIRRKDYAVLVEGQIDLVLSHQAGIDNTVASSGTAFTQSHLERLKRLSKRILLAFDGDEAGEKAAEKATILALSLGLEVKIAKLPLGKDPADIIRQDKEVWKEILRSSLPAIEHLLNKLVASEKDSRKAGKLIERKILPLVALLGSSIERSHFLSLISKKTGIKEEVLWDDLKKVKVATVASQSVIEDVEEAEEKGGAPFSKKQQIEERLSEVRVWLAELRESSGKEGRDELKRLEEEEVELMDHLEHSALRDELREHTMALREAEILKDNDAALALVQLIQTVLKKIRSLEAKERVL